MEFGYRKEHPNVYFRARKNAADKDETLRSRGRASEMLDLSVSTLSDYELGNMNADRLMEVLIKKYGIVDEAELENAISKIHGINLGLFSFPFERMEKKDEKSTSTYGNCFSRYVVN